MERPLIGVLKPGERRRTVDRRRPDAGPTEGMLSLIFLPEPPRPGVFKRARLGKKLDHFSNNPGIAVAK